MSDEKRTSIDSIGEFGLIHELTKDFVKQRSSTLYGVGDDAAVLERDEKTVTLVATDMLVEGIHFNLMYTPLKHLGYKAVVVNLSDIYAMNGEAEQITVSIGISSRFPKEAVEEIYEGIYAACKTYDVDLVGGDTTSSQSGLILSITAIGVAKKDDVVYRNGGKPNDLIVVSGDLGGAYMGLQVLEREKEVWKSNPEIQPDLDGFDYVLERQLKPEARRDIIQYLKELGVKPTAMMDISDGLASELFHLSRQSSVGVRIYDEKLPIDSTVSTTAIDFNISPTTCALNGGEDYELLFSIKQEDFDKIKGNPHMTVIGHFTNKDEGLYLIDKQNAAFELKAQGWDHFK
ncbi:MAG: thiamine-phosphate kinase [Brumimicrobium sp.]|nr:thiamine-phosphate kinase [Brumimicrobium sp.]MCO5269421.1 thiamine-phosphate kinase [Brumimicrobium sp.]